MKGCYISLGGSGYRHFSYFTTGYLESGGFAEVKLQSGATDELKALFFQLQFVG